MILFPLKIQRCNMLVYCNNGCGTSSSLLDVAENKVICQSCFEEVTGFSEFAKIAIESGTKKELNLNFLIKSFSEV